MDFHDKLFWSEYFLKIIFFNLLFIVGLTARSYRDCHWFSFFGNGTFINILNFSSHTWDFSLSMADIYRTVSIVVTGPRSTWTIMSSGNPIYHERHLSGRVQCSHRATTDVNNHQATPSMSYCWVHITLPSVGELKH